MGVLTVKLTKAQQRQVDRYVRRRGFASRSEFVRYALARTMEDDLTLEELEAVVEGRKDIAAGRTIPMDRVFRARR